MTKNSLYFILDKKLKMTTTNFKTNELAYVQITCQML